MLRKIKKTVLTSQFYVFMLLGSSLFFACQENDEFQQPEEFIGWKIEDNQLIFSDYKSMDALSGKLNKMTTDDYRQWCLENNFQSARLLFEKLIEEENEINEYYKSLLEQDPNAIVPEKEIHSTLYNICLEKGVIKIMEDDDGSYYDYNLREVNLASILNSNLKVTIGEIERRYNHSGRFEVHRKSGNEVFISNGFAKAESGSSSRIAITNPDHAWEFFGLPNNGWKKDGSRRFRVWLEGASKVTYSLEIYNNLRAQTQKKNIWGNWKFDGTRTLSVTNAALAVQTYNLQYFIWEDVGCPEPLLPLVAPADEATLCNPWSWSGLVNNAFIPLWPEMIATPSPNSGVRLPVHYFDFANINFGGHSFSLDYVGVNY